MCRALVITPTRELAAQVALSVQSYSRHLNIRSAVVFGGVRIEPQIVELQGGLDLLVATPGRLIDLYNQQALNFDHLEIWSWMRLTACWIWGLSTTYVASQMLLPSKTSNFDVFSDILC